ncbi:hypothetical protein QBC37DRAFT_429907 [Rhypophila decipiens]|uniref:Uncharacterized protein n=1 Tax=Rhypophila decipiens TaxID=261697 RepID=A0AAN7B6C3_9PEZI|nr:hypothetical protein QBC37DRAFT_429907 [Rhypophila decipiens]
MLPYSAVFALLLAFTAVAHDHPLYPWEITRLVVSGAPYRSEAACYDPLATIAVEIRDPNRYAGVNSSGSDMTQCITKFPYCGPPYNTRFNCTAIPYGNWTFSVSPDEGPDKAYWNVGQNFTLSLRLAIWERGIWFDGQARFSTWESLRGLCSAGGACSFSLREEMAPFLVHQREHM